MTSVAVIPARGGSKRIPRKNIREFCGKPMIGWTLETARASGLFDRLLVSTDDEEIASIAESYGAEVPFRRPDELSGDHVGTGPVIVHAVKWIMENWGRPEHVCTIYPTAPFLRAEDLAGGLKKLKESQDVQKTFAVTSFPYPIQRALRLTGDGRVAMFQPEYENYRSQDLEEAYHDAGQFYWSTARGVLDEIPTFSNSSKAVILPLHRVHDIDTEEDWKRAEAMFKVLEGLEEDL